ncbi:MAG: MerR family transcriptional regulator [Verrucomicrobia bacterium]|nr:MerR family transcriptional regulator [Verrucomicrobiota bacterium]
MPKANATHDEESAKAGTPAADYSLAELAAAVNLWCEEAGLEPANGQVGLALSERNIRFYRTSGLVDGPSAGGGRGYGETHLLQLTGIRILQAQGLPLRRIRELLYGRSLRELREIRERGRVEAQARTQPQPQPRPRHQLVPGESWQFTPVTPDVAVLLGPGRQITAEQLQRIREILAP